MVLNIDVGQRYSIVAPRGHMFRFVARQNEAVFIAVPSNMFGKDDSQMMTEQVEMIRIQQSEVEEHKESYYSRFEDNGQEGVYIEFVN